MNSFSEVFTELRKAKKLTQEELASALGLSRSRISMYEVGAREPDFEVLELIADYFNVDMDYLLGRSQSTTALISPDTVSLSKDEHSLLLSYRQLNDAGKEFARSSVSVLTNMEQYTR